MKTRIITLLCVPGLLSPLLFAQQAEKPKKKAETHCTQTPRQCLNCENPQNPQTNPSARPAARPSRGGEVIVSATLCVLPSGRVKKVEDLRWTDQGREYRTDLQRYWGIYRQLMDMTFDSQTTQDKVEVVIVSRKK